MQSLNNALHPPTINKKVADLVNDPNEVWMLPAKLESHHAFVQPLLLDHSVMPGLIMPKQVKRFLADNRARLMKAITEWELRGNGFGSQ